jgi:lipoyl(octanoyl) transferase
LDHFSHIIPCGIDDKTVTSMQKELGQKVDMEHVKQVLRQHIAALFDMQFQMEANTNC